MEMTHCHPETKYCEAEFGKFVKQTDDDDQLYFATMSLYCLPVFVCFIFYKHCIFLERIQISVVITVLILIPDTLICNYL